MGWIRNISKRLGDLWRFLFEVLIVGLTIGLFLAFIGAREDLRDVKSERDDALQDAGGLRVALSDAQEEIDRLRRLHPILELYGSDMWAMRSFDLSREQDEGIQLGHCGAPNPRTARARCYQIGLERIERDSEPPRQWFRIRGTGFGLLTIPGGLVRLPLRGTSGTDVTLARDGSLIFAIPLRRGERRVIRTAEVDFLVAIEDDAIDSLRAGIGLRPGTSGGGVVIDDPDRPEDGGPEH